MTSCRTPTSHYTDESTRVVLDLKYEFDSGVTWSSLSGYQDIESVNNLDLNATVPQHLRLQQPDLEARLLLPGIQPASRRTIRPSDGPSGLFWQEAGFPAAGLAGRVDSISSDSLLGPRLPPGADFPWATSPWDNERKSKAVVRARPISTSTTSGNSRPASRYGEYDRDQFTAVVQRPCSIPATAGAAPSTPLARNLRDGDRQNISESSTDWQVALNYDRQPRHVPVRTSSPGVIVSGGINIFPPFRRLRRKWK